MLKAKLCLDAAHKIHTAEMVSTYTSLAEQGDHMFVHCMVHNIGRGLSKSWPQQGSVATPVATPGAASDWY